MVLSFCLECLSLAFYILFGMALIPNFVIEDKKNKSDSINILIAPIFGLVIWQSITFFLGFIVPYNKIFLSIIFLFALIIIFYRRKALHFFTDVHFYIFICVVVISSLLVLWCVLPREINGGIYFTPSAFDHQRTAIINSIASTGIPPLNPYLAPKGIISPLYYHFGLQALAAQYKILFGIDGIIAGATVSALAYTITIMTIGFITIKLTGNKISLIFLLIFFVTADAKHVATIILPEALEKLLIFDDIGMWSIINDMMWSPHNMFAASAVSIIIWFYPIFLNEERKKYKIILLLFLAMMATTAITFSIYAGFFAMVLFFVAIIVLIISDSIFRKKFIKMLPYQLLCVTIFSILCLKYIIFLFQLKGTSPIEFGILTVYKINGFLDVLLAMLNFYLFSFPINTGIAIYIGMIAIFIPNIISNKGFLRLLRVYVIVVLIAVFFIHNSSSCQTNDFCWRTQTCARYFIIVFSSVGVTKLYEKFKSSNKIWLSNILLIVLLIFPMLFSYDLKTQSSVKVVDEEFHTTFAKARKGWEVIRKNTTYMDLVVCNPEGFREFDDSISKNYLFGYYADRLSCIADNYYTQTSCRGGVPNEEVEELYKYVVDFFSGDPNENEVNYMANVLKVKAILVTSRDGLWNKTGVLESKYGRMIEGENYRAYFLSN